MKKVIFSLLVAFCLSIQVISPVFAEGVQQGENEPIVFGDLQVKEAILQKGYIDADNDGEITPEELTKLGGTLDLSGKDITSLKGLEYAVGVQTLRVTKGSFEDASELSQMSALRDLTIKNTNLKKIPQLQDRVTFTAIDLEYNQIDDISALSSMLHLGSINLRGNCISDISALRPLVNLVSLHLEQNQITDIMPLEGAVKLLILGLADNPISDFEVLKNFTKIQTLDLSGTPLQDLNLLKDMGNLSNLSIADIPAVSMAPISDKTFYSLDISGTQFEDLSQISTVTVSALRMNRTTSDLSIIQDMKGISTLSISGNNLTDLAPIAGFTDLYQLICENNKVSDLTPLLKLQALQYMQFANNEVENVFPLILLEKLVYADLTGNKVNAEDGYTKEMLKSIQSNGTQLSLKGQNVTADSVPGTDVSGVRLSATVTSDTAVTTRLGIVSVRITCKNEAETSLENFDIEGMLPEGAQLAEGSGAITKHVDNLAPGGTEQLIFTFIAPSQSETGNILVAAQVTQGEKSYTVGAVNIRMVYATLNVPYRTAANKEFKVYGEATPGSTVTIRNDAGETLAEAVMNGKWYTATIPAQEEASLVLHAYVSEKGTEYKAATAYVQVQPDFVMVEDSYAWYRSKIKANPYTGIPTFSVFTNTRLIGDSFLIYTKFTQDDLIDHVTFQFADKTFTTQKNPAGYYFAVLNDWTARGTQTITADVSYLDETKENENFSVGQVTVLIDPSGQITDAQTNEPLEGAVVTLEQKQGEDWIKWDAESCMQENPQVTNEEGRYGWQVPEGVYRLKISRVGYQDKTVETYEQADGTVSDISILPIRTDVDVALESDGTGKELVQTVEEAAAAATLKLAPFQADNDTTKSAILDFVKLCIKNPNITADWKSEPTFIPADKDNPGKIEGIITFTDSTLNQTADVSVNLSILKLPAQTVTEIKSLFEELEYTLENETAKETIEGLLGKCIESTTITFEWTEELVVTNATYTSVGLAKGTIKLTDSRNSTTADIIINKEIPKVVQTVIDVAGEAIAAINAMPVSNATTAEDVMKTVTECIVNEQIHASWTEPFRKTEADETNEGMITGTITFADGAETKAVQITLQIPKLVQNLESAKAAIEAALQSFTASNDTTKEVLMTVIENCITNPNIAANWTQEFNKVNATPETAGSITGTVTLSDGADTKAIVIALEIPKTMQDLADAKASIELMLGKVFVTNEMTKEFLTDLVNACITGDNITAAWTKEFEKTDATTAGEGSVTGTITLTDSRDNTTEDIVISLTIARLRGEDPITLFGAGLYTEDGQPAEGALVPGSYEFKVDVENNTDTDLPFVLILAMYHKNADGTKELVQVCNIDAKTGTDLLSAKGTYQSKHPLKITDTQTFGQSSDNQNESGYEFVYMVWDGFDSVKPYTAPVTAKTI
jgi:hypothetical protein